MGQATRNLMCPYLKTIWVRLRAQFFAFQITLWFGFGFPCPNLSEGGGDATKAARRRFRKTGSYGINNHNHISRVGIELS